MKVRAIKEYFDKEKKKTIKPNTVEAEFEVSEERGGVLLAAGVVEDITEEQKEDTEADGEQVEDSQEDTEADEEKPKRPRKKKEPKNEQ
jgi:hypothetical protein